MKSNLSVSIIGFGRFGKVLHKLLKDDFVVTLFQRHSIDTSSLPKNTKIANSIKEALKSDVIFFATPIESFEQLIHDNKQFFRPNQLLIDVLSVKTLPAKVFAKELSGTNTRAMLTHPMFGPDSSKEGFSNLPIVMDQFSSMNLEFNFWKQFFISKGLKVIEMSPKKHDKTVAHTQALTHLLGRLLEEMNIVPTLIDTSTFKKLLEVREVVCKDSSELFMNMHIFNPHTARMRKKLKTKMNHLFSTLENRNGTIIKGDL